MPCTSYDRNGTTTTLITEHREVQSMDDTEKIVVEICRRKRDSATGGEVQQWTRLPRDRLVSTLESHRETLFHLVPAAGDPLGFTIELVYGEEMQKIVDKYADLLHHCKEEP
jgi:hypothetical protein